MANIAAVMETQQALEARLFKKMSELEAQLKATPPQQDNSLTRLREDLHDFKSHMLSVLKLLREQISGLCKSVDDLEMRHRRKYILVGGVPESHNNDLPEFVVDLFNSKLGLDISMDRLAACHRLGSIIDGKCRPVLVRFTERSLRSTVWSKKTALKGTPHTLSEFLTRTRQTVFLNARKRFGIRRCWTMDGNVILKMKDGSRQRLHTPEDLAAIPETEDEPDHPQAPAPSASATSPESRIRTKRTARGKK